MPAFSQRVKYSEIITVHKVAFVLFRANFGNASLLVDSTKALIERPSLISTACDESFSRITIRM